MLIDHDRVEPHNLLRQNFYPGEVGKFKSQALAERLSRQFGRPIRYSVQPYTRRLSEFELGGGLSSLLSADLIIGCVDNAPARREIAHHLGQHTWWLDAGNGYSSGQVLIGNRYSVEYLYGGFNQALGQVRFLPAPGLQAPSLLIPPSAPDTPQADCAEAVEREEQSPVINQAMATLVLEFVYRLLAHKLTWMGAYIDLDAGTLKMVPAEPETVARMFGIRANKLMALRPKRPL